MTRALRTSPFATSEDKSSEPTLDTMVGASYAFDPGKDGLAGIYAARVLDRGGDPRALCAEVRADRLGAPERGAVSRALMERTRASRFGRGTAPHLQLQSQRQAQVQAPAGRAASRRAPRAERSPFRHTLTNRPPMTRWSRRLAAAGIAVMLLLPLGVIAANAQEAPHQTRYIVQAGDTIESVAAEFGVDPAAILAASALRNAPYLTAEEVIVIPDPASSPEAAANTAMMFQGVSPFVVGAHDVAQGETLADIAYWYGLDPWALAAFNGISDIDTLDVGQRLRIPLTDAVSSTDEWQASDLTMEPAWAEAAPEGVGGAASGWEEPAAAPVFAAEVPAYMQAYSLSCEYAAAFIATSAFGPGVPESAFMEAIGPSDNPHWGYRGDISGPWGGTDDYGVYPEALAPTLNNYGFVADVFYGGDAASLTARLDSGMPVMAWLGYFGDTAWQQYDAGSYLLAPGMHVVTVYGYDDGGVYLVNPGSGNYDYYTWGDFLDKWSVLDGMALAVAPM